MSCPDRVYLLVGLIPPTLECTAPSDYRERFRWLGVWLIPL